MQLVVDTNVLFSFFQKSSETRELILNFEVLDLHAPSFSIEELKKHRELICEKSKLSTKEFEEVLEDLLLFLQLAPLSEYKESLPKAKEISPDPADVDFFALALKLDCPLWSNDKALRRQSHVKVFSTSELIKKIF